MRRRTVLIEDAPKMWIEGGLVYVDFEIEHGTLLAFRPSAWMASCALGQQVAEEWHASAAPAISLKYKDTG